MIVPSRHRYIDDRGGRHRRGKWRRRGDERLSHGEQTQESITPHGIKFTEDIIEEQEGDQLALSLDQFMARQTNRQRQRSLLTLGRLASGVSIVQSEVHVVTVGTDGGIATTYIVAQNRRQ